MIRGAHGNLVLEVLLDGLRRWRYGPGFPKTRRAVLSAVLSLAVVPALEASPLVYRVLDLGMLPGDLDSYAYGLNNSGDVVGQSANVETHTHQAFLYRNGELQDLSASLGDGESVAYGINDRGQVAGAMNGLRDGFLYSDGVVTPIPRPSGALSTEARDVNDAGDATGTISFGTSTSAFLFHDGALDAIGTLPGDDISQARAINNVGQIVGTSIRQQPNLVRPFLYEDGEMRPLSGSFGSAFDINESGQVAGTYSGHAFLYSNGVLRDLGALPGDTFSAAFALNNRGDVIGSSGSRFFLVRDYAMMVLANLIWDAPGWQLDDVWDINDRGQIVGTAAFAPDGSHALRYHAVLLSPMDDVQPVPEPDTFFLFAVGLTILSMPTIYRLLRMRWPGIRAAG